MQIMSLEAHGIEKIIEYQEATNSFKENSFNVRHMYQEELENHKDIETWNAYTYYSNWRTIEDEENTRDRLIRIVQSYKSKYYLNHQTSRE